MENKQVQAATHVHDFAQERAKDVRGMLEHAAEMTTSWMVRLPAMFPAVRAYLYFRTSTVTVKRVTKILVVG